ncbi:MAG: transcription-repair coupling factor, partial [Gammaproteobacteria bacterium]|nr:transcription-repair coupling factor [Gammaproteobacteria bacterium]
MFTPNQRFGGQLKPLLNYIRGQVESEKQVYLVSRQSSRLKELWEERAKPVTSNQPIFIPGSLTEGWNLQHPNGPDIQILTDGEIFGWRRPLPRKRHRPVAEAPEAEYANLSNGDWVVHIDHGVGQYIGLVRRVIDRVEREYICVEYAEGDQLFVPIHQADRLTRYVGPTSRPPTPTRLGAAEWSIVKSRVSEAVKEMAEDLLDLYVQRNVIEGFAFSEDTPWQKELEASFPYIETEDQRIAIQEVKRDMEATQPMDRLLCGDVGFGKTEVALRAAFKAVMDNKQVAILVPTTVLAQ